jgi:hypothetical protein
MELLPRLLDEMASIPSFCCRVSKVFLPGKIGHGLKTCLVILWLSELTELWVNRAGSGSADLIVETTGRVFKMILAFASARLLV